jgi:hypothetical protein
MKHINKYLIIISLVGFSFSLSAQGKKDDIRFHISTGLNFYQAFSQKKNSMVMKMGYPVLRGNSFQIGGKISWSGKKSRHHLNLNISHLPTMTSDDGLGNNFLLQKAQSNLTGIILEHRMERTLFSYQSFDLDFAPLAGLDFQLRNVTYTSDSREQTTDINIFMGLRTVPKFHINKTLSLQAGFDSFFYLPYLNTGTLKKWDRKDNLVEKTSYYAFYYRTRFHASVKYKANNDKTFRLGYRNNKTVGFANSKPLFYIEELVHHRMDRYHNFFIEYEF